MTSSNGNIFRVTGPLCGEFAGPGEFPTQRPVTRSFDVFFDLRPNKRLSKQSPGWWFETLSRPFWRHRNVTLLNAVRWMYIYIYIWLKTTKVSRVFYMHAYGAHAFDPIISSDCLQQFWSIRIRNLRFCYGIVAFIYDPYPCLCRYAFLMYLF